MGVWMYGCIWGPLVDILCRVLPRPCSLCVGEACALFNHTIMVMYWVQLCWLPTFSKI